MEQTHLIQRLKEPTDSINPFAFGAGLRNGGLSDEAMGLVSQIWSFDYMGNGRFECGAVREALEKIFDYSTSNKTANGNIRIVKGKNVHYICESSIEDDVEQIVRQLYRNENKFNLSSGCFLRRSMKEEEYHSEFLGWLELDNGFMFFKDKSMYESSLGLFGIGS